MFIHPRMGHLEREILMISMSEILEYIIITYYKDRLKQNYL